MRVKGQSVAHGAIVRKAAEKSEATSTSPARVYNQARSGSILDSGTLFYLVLELGNRDNSYCQIDR